MLFPSEIVSTHFSILCSQVFFFSCSSPGSGLACQLAPFSRGSFWRHAFSLSYFELPQQFGLPQRQMPLRMPNKRRYLMSMYWRTPESCTIYIYSLFWNTEQLNNFPLCSCNRSKNHQAVQSDSLVPIKACLCLGLTNGCTTGVREINWLVSVFGNLSCTDFISL